MLLIEQQIKKPKGTTYPSFIETKTVDGETQKTKDKTEIANAMNKQFTGMGGKLAGKLPSTNTKFSDYLKSPSKESMFLHQATELEVGKHFHEINVNKGIGVDENHPKLLKWGQELFVPIITKLFNKCLDTGVYPDKLKIARVIPIFKGGNKNTVTSYRPISILTQFNRIFEKLLKDRLYSFLGKKSIRSSLDSNPSIQLSSLS